MIPMMLRLWYYRPLAESITKHTPAFLPAGVTGVRVWILDRLRAVIERGLSRHETVDCKLNTQQTLT